MAMSSFLSGVFPRMHNPYLRVGLSSLERMVMVIS
jgi:hypothetical protein